MAGRRASRAAITDFVATGRRPNEKRWTNPRAHPAQNQGLLSVLGFGRHERRRITSSSSRPSSSPSSSLPWEWLLWMNQAVPDFRKALRCSPGSGVYRYRPGWGRKSSLQTACTRI